VVRYSPGLAFSRDSSRRGFAEAVEIARSVDLVLFFGGEEAILSGEAHSRADLKLPGAQQELIRELAGTGTPVVLVLLSGRPLTVHETLADIDALLMAWHPGTMGGPALADLLLGEASPSGRLPFSWPKAAGQIPIHYNHKSTGRPAVVEELVAFDEIPVGAWQSSLSNTSHYLDLGAEPEFPFGFGLTYSTFLYEELEISAESMTADGSIEISAMISNTGSRLASEVVQLYVRDLVASRTRPVRQLEGFRKITLEPGARQRVRFSLAAADLKFHDGGTWVLEPGRFEIWIAPDAVSGLRGTFDVR
jgi:beta-glucosidase